MKITRKTLLLVSVCFSTLVATGVKAELSFWSGNSLLVYCDPKEADSLPEMELLLRRQCEAYVRGVAEGYGPGYIGGYTEAIMNGFLATHERDSIEFEKYRKRVSEVESQQAHADKGFGYCIEPSMTPEQLVMVVRQHLRQHPEQLHQPAAYLVMAALQEAFPEPCGRAK